MNRHLFKGPFTTKRQNQRCDNSAMTLAILFSLKTMELLENRLQPHSGVTPLFSIRTESLVSSQSCRCIDADAWCKRALKCLLFRMILTIFYTMSEGWERKMFNFEVFIVNDNYCSACVIVFLRPACVCVSFVVECPPSP